MKVAKVNEWMNPSKGKPQWFITLDDGTEAVCYDEKAKALVLNDDLPQGWVVDPPKQEGWKAMLRAPGQTKGGGGGYKGRSVEEQLRIDSFQQERMDRRTALMQAVQWIPTANVEGIATVHEIADDFYAWLRKTAETPKPPPLSVSAQGAAAAAVRPPSTSGEGEGAYTVPAKGHHARAASNTSAPSPEPTSEEPGQPTGKAAELPGSSDPATPEQFDRLLKLFGGRVNLIRASGVAKLSEISFAQAETLILEKVT